MEIEFEHSEHYEFARDRRAATRKWGQPVAEAYLLRLRQIQAAESELALRQLRQLRLHKLRGYDRMFAIDLHARWRLLVTFRDATVIIEEVSNHYDD